ncbi:ImmA/IrrE family metallo-endopeptidase [Listeria monocytogenes]|nr:ImmA/IrrE family metallo-endopeptidase [Listeria monocytogenes]
MYYMKHYKPTMIELRMSESMKRHGITRPAQLDTEKIQIAYNVLVMEMDFPSAAFGAFGIVLSRGLRGEDYKKAFFHEFAHWLEHAGNQLQMTRQQKLMQEQQAEQMSLYLRIPFHMLNTIDLSSEDCIIEISETFNVPIELAKQRLKKIKDNVLCHSGSEACLLIEDQII